MEYIFCCLSVDSLRQSSLRYSFDEKIYWKARLFHPHFEGFINCYWFLKLTKKMLVFLSSLSIIFEEYDEYREITKLSILSKLIAFEVQLKELT